MKTLIIIFSILFMSLSSAMAVWQGDYELDNGGTVSRRPSKITVTFGSITMSSKSDVTFATTSNYNGIIPTADGTLSITQTPTQFRKNVIKLGKIRSKRVSDPDGKCCSIS